LYNAQIKNLSSGGTLLSIEIYCDESRQDLFSNKGAINEYNRYICIGGISVSETARKEMKLKIKEIQKKHNVLGEFKWKRVTPSKYEFYEELIDLFFSYDNNVRFRCVVIDARQIDMKKYNNDDSELGFYKFYYQLLVYWINNNERYKIYTDCKVNKKNTRLKELKEILNNKCNNNVELIQAIDSKESLMLQLEDILMGAVGYRCNFLNNGEAVAKNKLIEKIQLKLNTELNSPSLRYNNKFNIFKMNLRRNK
jgi:hypothetical protein